MEKRKKAQEIWTKTLASLRTQVNAGNYRTWLENTSGLCRRGNDFIVSVPDSFVMEYLDGLLRPLIEKTLIQLTLRRYKIFFLVEAESPLIESPQTVLVKPPGGQYFQSVPFDCIF